MIQFRVSTVMLALSAFVFSASLVGCENAWHGVKQDTGENMEKTGESLERAGEKTKPDKTY